MTTVAGRIVIALVLFATGLACVREARDARRVADAYSRLATLQYGSVTGADDTAERWQPAWLPTMLATEETRNVAAASYWSEDFDRLTTESTLADLAGTEDTSEPTLLFISANAAFRSARAQTDETPELVQRLDRVIQAYGEVLRANPAHADASFNFEYVSRLRDTLAAGTTGRRSSARGEDEESLEPIPSPDLPIGPTIHGWPGGPPEDIPGSDFRTLVPVPFDEREETDPGEGATPRRKG